MLLLIPFPWLCGWGSAVLIHELSHCVALHACGKRINMVYLDIDGVRIWTEPLSDLQMLLCSLSGPIGGLSLLFIAEVFPQAALCAILLSCYNLLPVFPLDGGRAFYGFVHFIFSENTCEFLCSIVENLVLLGLILLCVFSTFVWKFGALPLLTGVLLTMRMFKIKRPCKSTLNKVQ